MDKELIAFIREKKKSFCQGIYLDFDGFFYLT